MSQKRSTAEEIVGKLREAEILLSQNKTVGEVMRQLAADLPGELTAESSLTPSQKDGELMKRHYENNLCR